MFKVKLFAFEINKARGYTRSFDKKTTPQLYGDIMSEFIQMPDVSELKEELAAARIDIQEAIKEQPELENQSKFLMEVLSILDNRLTQEKDLNALSKEDQISVLAHLNLFYSLLEDTFGDDLDFDDEDLYDFDDEEEDEEYEEEEEEEDAEEKK